MVSRTTRVTRTPVSQTRSTTCHEARTGEKRGKLELARSPEEMLASSGSARSDCVEMTKTKIRSAIGFGGEGYEDAEGDTAASAPQSASPVKSVARLAVLRTRIWSGKKGWRRRR